MAAEPRKGQKGPSLYLEQVILDYSFTSCVCDIFFPQPALRFNELGLRKELIQEEESEGFTKKCRVHLCEILDVSPDFSKVLHGTDIHSKIFLHVNLNGLNTGDLTYQKTDQYKITFQQKTGNKWRTFVLNFGTRRTTKKFITSLENRLKQLVAEDCKHSYILVAVPPETSRTSILNRQKRNSTASENQEGQSDSDISSAAEEENGEKEGGVYRVDKSALPSLTPPFDPAPFSPNYRNYNIYQDDSNDEAEKEEVTYKTKDVSLTDSLNIHTSELPQSLRTVLKSINKDSEGGNEDWARFKRRSNEIQATGPTDEVLNSEFLPTEKLYIQMGVQTNSAMEDKHLPNVLREEVEMEANLLQTAINEKDVTHAQEYAKQLAMKDVVVTISAKLKFPETNEKNKEFNLKVYIEDKETSGASIILKVKGTDTIRDLKSRMLIKHGFPIDVQNWIVGQRIPPDNQTLSQCRIKTSGHSVFLYLVSAKSLGLVKEDSMRQGSGYLNIADHRPVPQDPPVVERTASSAGSSHSSNRNFSVPTPGSAISSATLGGGATGGVGGGAKGGLTLPRVGLGSGAAMQMPNVLDTNLNKKQEKKQMAGNKLSNPNIPDDRRPIQMVIGTPQEELITFPQPLNMAAHGTRTPMEHIETTGWACSACTFINQPTRPGCEVCSNPRPDDYIIPEGYEMTEEEKQRLEYERLLEQQTQKGGTQRRYGNTTEKELHELLLLHDALQDTIQQQQKKEEETRPDQQPLNLHLLGMGPMGAGQSDSGEENSL